MTAEEKKVVDFSFVVLTYNEEIHLPRLLESIKELGAPVFVLDSGSTDRTLKIAEEYGAIVAVHPFENHPKQWAYALDHFPVTTPWIIGLDADQIVTPELFELLRNFSDNQVPADVNGIFFNRKNYFKGRWIRYGGYFPKYLLKMFRKGVGQSDLSQNMDHRFVVPGKHLVWNKGYLIEENLKENDIAFWIEKHNRYSTLQAHEEFERRRGIRAANGKGRFFGHPDERILWLKNLWWRAPLYLRPFLYFFWRYFLQLGFLDGKQGFVFHFLQAFWYRLLVDIKIDELKKADKN
ncbi:MAG: glycosyltransferase family 2 protein [Saprospiraceae bacterium]